MSLSDTAVSSRESCYLAIVLCFLFRLGLQPVLCILGVWGINDSNDIFLIS